MLLDTLEKDCRDWISSNEALFMNEYDMQVKLSHYLAKAKRYLVGSKHYDDVRVEYVVPKDMLSNRLNQFTGQLSAQYLDEFCNGRHMMRADIVVEKDGKFAVVELKYAPAPIDEEERVFGESVSKALIKDNAAVCDVRYAYWEDVRRIEALTSFENVEGGIALIVSNDRVYRNHHDETPAYLPFSLHEGHEVGTPGWKWHNAPSKTYPPFTVGGEYTCKWGPTKIPYLSIKGKDKVDDDERSFKFLMLKVKKVFNI